ncbi:hypothetical protein Pcinc_023436 [Petrolisthes cinctipes]|uniref:Uncharacterized protein n=1 Tax=Petrolisthes cinctipes TaxID=88211 RepID=A0AAE1FD02_PETCI|nr:hypothetical protein Pcinc_023436 [Petrolisthes cinctipes]
MGGGRGRKEGREVRRGRRWEVAEEGRKRGKKGKKMGGGRGRKEGREVRRGRRWEVAEEGRKRGKKMGGRKEGRGGRRWEVAEEGRKEERCSVSSLKTSTSHCKYSR